MLSCYAEIDGEKKRIKNILTARLSSSVDIPADELVLTVPYDGKFREADRLSAYDGDELVFTGSVDETTSIAADDKAIVKISARSLAGALLDNEAEPITYVNPSASFIFAKHLKPFGITGYSGEDAPFLGSLAIEKGMTHWQVLEKFCAVKFGKSPVISGGGFAFMNGCVKDDAVTFGKSGTKYSSVRERRKPCMVLSRIRLKLGDYGGYASRLDNPAAPQGLVRERYVNATGSGSLSAADRMIENGNINCLDFTLECPCCICGKVGFSAVLDDKLFGRHENLTVKSTEYVLGGSGESTTVVLGKESFNVADGLYN